MLSGGFGSGKTTGLVRKVLQLKSINGAVPGAIIAQDYPALMGVVVENLVDQMARVVGVADAHRLCRVRMGKGRYIDFGDGAPIFLRSAKNPRSVDSLNVGWLAGDELRLWKWRAYEYAIARARIRCPMNQRAFATTPATGKMANEFNTGKKNRRLITAPTKENVANLEDGYIENIRQSYSPRMAKALLDGMFVPLEGAVYEVLDPDFWSHPEEDDEPNPHVIDYDPEKNLHRKTYLAVDPGVRRSSWLWIHEVGRCEWVVFDQFNPEQMSDAACVEAVNSRGWPIDEIWCDPAADARQSAIDMRTVDVLHAIKTRVKRDAVGDVNMIGGVFRGVEMGVDKVRTLLGDPEMGLPVRLRFARRLEENERKSERGIVKDMLAYTYPEIQPGRTRIHQPFKDNITDHSNDALRYWAMGMWLTSDLYYLDPIIQGVLARTKTAGYRKAA